jgi:L,D-peptidoglycan transpeptidase YkuD (ErfK/YbiS/YcfS/YnhG family)
MSMRNPWPALAACLLPVLLSACVHRPTAASGEATRWSNATQLILVTTPDWNAPAGTLRTFERDGGEWKQIGHATPVTIGRTGAAWGLGLNDVPAEGPRKREGDGRSPAGVFAIGTAFGYATQAHTALPYAPMDGNDYCIDVPESRFYNRIVDAREVGTDAVAGSTEPMRRDLHAGGDQRYRLGFVIEHNAGARPSGGSCIFAHLWKSPRDATAGCTAMADAAMERILAWLDPARHPVFVLLPDAEYPKRASAWQLPTPSH